MNTKRPLLSLVVIAHNMAAQLSNTLHSLFTDYQRGINQEDYEVLILENNSAYCLPQNIIEKLPANFSYTLRDEKSPSPVAAVNEGLRRAKGEWLGLMIDGAHLLTPGVLQYIKLAQKIDKNAFVTVPAYHLGYKEQNESAKEGYNEQVESELLEKISWPENGYRLFEIGTRCANNDRGYFAPILESNCFFAPRQAYEKIGYADMDFQLPGGGSINLHMTRQLGTLEELKFITLAGEGSFHQFHGGVTSSAQRELVVEDHKKQLHGKWGGDYKHLARNPIILGHFPEPALNELHESSKMMVRRSNVCKKNNWPLWPDDL